MLTTLNLRRAGAATALAVAAATLACPTSASATDIDDEDVAARVCPAGASFLDLESGSSSDEADALLFSYSVDDEYGEPVSLCTFAIISTDDDRSTLSGSYALSVGSQQVTGAVTGDAFATAGIVSAPGDAAAATLTSDGVQRTVVVKKASKGTKKNAKKALAAARKKAKSAYAKAGKTTKARKMMASRMASATKKYRRTVATTRTTTTSPYRLGVVLGLPLTGSLPADPGPDEQD